jgi:DeoR/GlpR family transcriptional regulator of sugar metabolism
MLSQLQVDTAFIGCDAFDAEKGAMSNSLSKVAIKRAMLHCARRRILLADASKCGQRALATFADWDQFHAIVTDHHLPVEFQEQCRQRGIEVLIADNGGRGHAEARGNRR